MVERKQLAEIGTGLGVEKAYLAIHEAGPPKRRRNVDFDVETDLVKTKDKS